MPIVIGQLVLIAILGYLWGSIPSGYWMGKLLRGREFDIRSYGSHKTGATNVRRILGNGPAAIVFVVDLSKGVGPTLLATLLFSFSGWGPTVIGLAALVGHNFPVFIGFKGGRGVLTGAGAVLVISPLIFLIGITTIISTIVISRYISLASIVGSLMVLVCGVLFYFTGRLGLAQMAFFVIGAVFVILSHYDNIGRLLIGKEVKLGQEEIKV